VGDGGYRDLPGGGKAGGARSLHTVLVLWRQQPLRAGLAHARRGTCSAVLELPHEVFSALLHVPSNVLYFLTSSLETVIIFISS